MVVNIYWCKMATGWKLQRGFCLSDHCLTLLLLLLLFSQPSPLVARLQAGAAQPSTLQLLWPCPLLLPTQQPAGHRQCHGQTTSAIATTGRRDQGPVPDPPEQRLSFRCWRDRTRGEACWAWTPHFWRSSPIFPLGGLWIQDDSRPSVSLSAPLGSCSQCCSLQCTSAGPASLYI